MVKTLYELGVLKPDGSFNPRAGMSLANNVKYESIWKDILNKTSFLSPNAPNSQRIHALVHDISNAVVCTGCKTNETRFISFNAGYQSFCSCKCAQNDKSVRTKIKETNLNKYGYEYPCGNDTINTKRATTCQDRYGSDTPFENQDIQRKVRTTIRDKYGVNSTALVHDIKKRQKQTRVDRLGVEYPFQSEAVQHKVTQTHLAKFNRTRYSNSFVPAEVVDRLTSEEWMSQRHVVDQKPLTDIACELGVSDVTVGSYLHKHGICTQHFFSSTGEKEVLQFIKELLPNTTIEPNTRNVISPYELDIYLPEYKLAIEYCGLYWHSDLFKPRNYHRTKYQLCKEQNIRLLTIFDDEWFNTPDIVKAKIKNILGQDDSSKIFARKTQIVRIDTQRKNKFLDMFHIQGSGPGSITYGLEHDGALVAVMTFIKKKNGIFELNRYATSVRVIGGFGKLLKHFQQNHAWKEIISFADLRWSEGNLYEITGWVLDKVLPPDYYWCKNGKRYHKFGFRHKNLRSKLVDYDPKLSENDNCKQHGYTKIFNCGLNRYVLKG